MTRDPFNYVGKVVAIDGPLADEAAADAGLENESACWIVESYQGFIPSPYIDDTPSLARHRYRVRHVHDGDDPQSVFIAPEAALSWAGR